MESNSGANAAGEQFIYVSDWTADLADRVLDEVGKTSKQGGKLHVIFTGDIADTPTGLEITHEFYTRLNIVKELKAAGKNDGEIDAALKSKGLGREYLGVKVDSAKHSGHFISKLAKEHSDTVKGETRQSVGKIISVMEEMREKYGANVHVVLGNVDMRLRHDFKDSFDGKTPIPLNEPERELLVWAELAKNGIPHSAKQFDYIETDETVHVFAPFDAITAPDFKRLEAVSKAAKEMRERTGKKIVLVPHGVPFYEMHDLATKEPKMTGESGVLQENMPKILGMLAPDVVVYGHAHTPRKDAHGNPIPDSITMSSFVSGGVAHKPFQTCKEGLEPPVTMVEYAFLREGAIAHADYSRERVPRTISLPAEKSALPKKKVPVC